MGNALAFPALGATRGMTVTDLVRELSDTLGRAGIEHAPREARDIIAALCDQPRFWPSVHGDQRVEARMVDTARRAALQRARGAPFAYAVGRAAFRYLTLVVDGRVLIPRQETELLVDHILAFTRTGRVIDLGTGSGAIALALASEGDFERIIATDVSRDALAVARDNAQRLGGILSAPVDFRHGSLFAPLDGERVEVLASNPPYIAFEETPMLPRSVRNWEPPLALLAARNGMAVIESIVRGGADVLVRGGLLALEIDARRASLAAELVMTHGSYSDVRIERDLAGRERILLATRR